MLVTLFSRKEFPSDSLLDDIDVSELTDFSGHSISEWHNWYLGKKRMVVPAAL